MNPHYGRAKTVVTLYYFLGVLCLNFNYVIIVKDFHNVFTYYGRSEPPQKKKKTTFIYSYDVRFDYIFAKKMYITTYWKMKIYSRNDWNNF